MSSSLRRDRLVVFRLTQEEYRLLQAACTAAGRRSVSEFTRTELLSIVQSDSVDASVRHKLMEIDRKLDQLLQRHTSRARVRLEAVSN
jgi:hypothetical protein